MANINESMMTLGSPPRTPWLDNSDPEFVGSKITVANTQQFIDYLKDNASDEFDINKLSTYVRAYEYKGLCNFNIQGDPIGSVAFALNNATKMHHNKLTSAMGVLKNANNTQLCLWVSFVNKVAERCHNQDKLIIFQLEHGEAIPEGLNKEDSFKWAEAFDWFKSMMHYVEMGENVLLYGYKLIKPDVMVELGKLTNLERRLAIIDIVFTKVENNNPIVTNLWTNHEPDNELRSENLNWDLVERSRLLEKTAQLGESSNAMLAWKRLHALATPGAQGRGLLTPTDFIKEILGIPIPKRSSLALQQLAVNNNFYGIKLWSLVNLVLDIVAKRYEQWCEETNGKPYDYVAEGNIRTLLGVVSRPYNTWSGKALELRVVDWLYNLNGYSLRALFSSKSLIGPNGAAMRTRLVARLDEITPADIKSVNDGVHKVFRNMTIRKRVELDSLDNSALVPESKLPACFKNLPKGAWNLNTHRFLAQEGIEMNHCAADFHKSVSGGKCFILSLQINKCRATVEIVRPSYQFPHYQVGQLYGFKNSDVSPEMRQFAEDVCTFISDNDPNKEH